MTRHFAVPAALALVCACLVPLASAAQTVAIHDPMPAITHILGSAQMDMDAPEEIAILYGDERLMIIDSYSGAVEFDSDGWGWSYVLPPGYNREDTVNDYSGHNRGFDVFVDDDGDGIFCLMTLISQISIYEQQLAVICLRQPPTSVGDDTPPRSTSLDQNHPNPFNPQTTITYNLVSAGPTVMKIYDVRGTLVRTLLNEVQTAGQKRIVWDGTDDGGRTVASGTYFYQLETSGRLLTKKSILIK